ncbi:cysteine synthase A [Clostridium sp. JN-9]|uniref:cysteine synthase A n=1 Tax=Clostridium sp. JN-9 TaxID=2507159 RepID=UPI000FFE2215|nr:cysteine synthase A [Clostridium sp. JN-9]QAT39037.1 cysteine synthase A [Clostridium sp. JN-9]
MIYDNALDLIGNTPMLKLNRAFGENTADIYVKLEKYNPGGSIKDRIALGMIEDAEKKGLLKPDSVIVEPTSGNTGIGLALVGRLKGYKVIIVMPDTMTVERRSLIKAYGAELVLTQGSKGMKGAIQKAEELVKENKGYFVPQQFSNESNPAKHYETTADEILKEIPEFQAFTAGVGTGGTITGVGRKLKEKLNSVEIVAVEPESSPVLSGGQPGPHKIQGIGAGFVPDVYDEKVIDSILTISNEEAYHYARLVGREQGILIGISSGANIAAAVKIAKKLGSGKKVVTVAPDGGEKYISAGLYD